MICEHFRRLGCVTLILVSPLAAGADYGSATVDEIRSVYDGDTFRATITAWPPVAGENVPIRVDGVDTPEIRGKCAAEKSAAKAAREFAAESLRSAQVVELRKIHRGKYFRLLAEVWVDDANLADVLIQAGHGRLYEGGRRKGWCD